MHHPMLLTERNKEQNIVKKKRVCIVSATIPPAFGGGGLRAYRYAERLHKKNKLAFILTSWPIGKDRLTDQSSKETIHSIIPQTKIIRVRTLRYHYGSGYRAICGALGSIADKLLSIAILLRIMAVRHRSFEIIHCYGVNWFSLLSVLVGKIFGKKCLMEMTLVDGDDPQTLKNNVKLPGIGRLKLWILSRSDVVISISPALSQVYKASGLPVEKLREISNPVDIKRFSPVSHKEKRALRRMIGIEDSGPVILFVGIIIKRKGVDLLIRSFQKMLGRYPNALLLLVGPVAATKENREFVSEMQDLIQELSISNSVLFTGQVENVQDYMRASDLFVFPSRREGLPNVITEAMACGLPVIALRIPNITEAIIEHRKDGIIVEKEDSSMIASAIVDVLEDKKLYDSLSENARKTAVARFSTQRADLRYEQIYSDILKTTNCKAHMRR